MAKHGATKGEILELISRGHDTLSSISTELGLAPSTVSKHLQDLEASGAIVQKENSHVKKWKYYMLNDSGNRGAKNGMADANWSSSNKSLAKVLLPTILILAVAGLAYYAVVGGTGAGAAGGSGTAYVPISITDPPHVPQGTEALYLNYSSLTLTLENGGSTQTMVLDASGRLDLLGLVNETEVIGEAAIPANSTLRAITFNISSASMLIGNSTYDVQLQDKQVSAYVAADQKLNKSSGILLDFSPTVFQLQSSYNGTHFGMLPSMRATVVPNLQPQNSSLAFMTQRYPLPQMFRNALQGTNLSIVSSRLSFSGDNVSFGVVLKNNGTDNTTIIGLVIAKRPPEPVQAGPSLGQNGNNSRPSFYKQMNSTLVINATRMEWNGSWNGTISINTVNPFSRVIIMQGGGGRGQQPPGPGQFGRMQQMAPTIPLTATENGTLVAIQQGMQPGVPSMPPQGFVLGGMKSEAFSYNGTLWWNAQQGFGSGNYTITVITNKGVVQGNISV